VDLSLCSLRFEGSAVLQAGYSIHPRTDFVMQAALCMTYHNYLKRWVEVPNPPYKYIIAASGKNWGKIRRF